MEIILRIGYLLGTIVLGLAIYYWSSAFKKIGDSSLEEFNEGEENIELIVTASQAKAFNYFGTIIFTLIGFFIWAALGITVGKIASDITDYTFLKWVCYFFMYFIFLRLPFGIINRIVQKIYDFRRFSEKIVFSITMIVFYILSICCYDIIPNIFKWHLSYLQ